MIFHDTTTALYSGVMAPWNQLICQALIFFFMLYLIWVFVSHLALDMPFHHNFTQFKEKTHCIPCVNKTSTPVNKTWTMTE